MAFNQQKYIDEYAREHYDRVTIKVPKGKKDTLRNLAIELHITDDKGKISVNKLIVEAIEKTYGVNLGRT